jgi:hypothetical protein
MCEGSYSAESPKTAFAYQDTLRISGSASEPHFTA